MKSSKPIARLATIAAVAATLVASTMPSWAFRMIQPLTTGRVTAGYAVPCSDPGGFAHPRYASVYWYLNPSGQGAGKSTAIQKAMKSWTDVPSANHVLSLSSSATAAGFITDGRNTVVFAQGNGCTGNCLALTALVVGRGWVINESDITFNSNYLFNTNGSDFDTEAIAAHELGHSLGIHHTELTSTPLPTMYFSYAGTGVGGRTLENDDRAALQCSQNRYPPLVRF